MKQETIHSIAQPAEEPPPDPKRGIVGHSETIHTVERSEQ